MAQRASKNWKARLVEVNCPDPPVVNLENLDVLEWEERLKSSGTNTLLLVCKDHWGACYYDTRVGHIHPGLTFDFVSEMSQMLRSNKIEFVAYYSIGMDNYAATVHPEWGARDARSRIQRCLDGDRLKWLRCCTMTGYMEHVLEQLEEIVENYDPNGLYLDAFSHPLCYCDDCQRKFREKYGFPIPRRGQDISRHLRQCDDFSNHSVDLRCLQEIRTLLKKLRSDCWISFSDSWRRHRKIRGLVDCHILSETSDLWATAVCARRLTSDLPLMIKIDGPTKAHDFRSDGAQSVQVGEVIAQDALPLISSASMKPDGSVDRLEFERAERLYDELDEIQPLVARGRSLSCVAIINHERTQGLLPELRQMDRVLHAIRRLGPSQLPIDVLLAEDLTPMKLAPYQLVVLPDVCYLEEDLVKVLTSFVKRGGSLLSTQQTGLFDMEGLSRNEFSLADVFGCEFCGINSEFVGNRWGSYLELEEHPIWSGRSLFQEPPTPPPYVRLRLTTGQAAAIHILPATAEDELSWVGWGPVPGATLTEDPAMVVNEYGSGRSIYTSFNFFHEDLEWPQHIVPALMHWLVPEPIIHVRCPVPSQLETSYFKKKKLIFVHMINRFSERVGEDGVPISGAVLSVRKSFAKVSSAEMIYPNKCKLKTKSTKELTQLNIPRFDCHSILRLKTR